MEKRIAELEERVEKLEVALEEASKRFRDVACIIKPKTKGLIFDSRDLRNERLSNSGPNL